MVKKHNSTAYLFLHITLWPLLNSILFHIFKYYISSMLSEAEVFSMVYWKNRKGLLYWWWIIEGIFSAPQADIFQPVGVKGNQVQVLSDPVTVSREWDYKKPLRTGVRRHSRAMICEPGNLLKRLMKSFRRKRTPWYHTGRSGIWKRMKQMAPAFF